MAFQRMTRGLPIPAYLNETGTLQRLGRSVYIDETVTAPAPPSGNHLLTTMGVGGMVVPSVGDTLAAAAGAALLRNPRVTRRRLLTGGQDGDD